MYGQYNPYLGQYNNSMSSNQFYQPQTQPTYMQSQIQQPKLQGKVVESEEVVRNIEVPLDGSLSYFPTADKSKIITKSIQNDGTSKILIYELINEPIKNEYVKINDFDNLKEHIIKLEKEINKLKKGDDNE